MKKPSPVQPRRPYPPRPEHPRFQPQGTRSKQRILDLSRPAHRQSKLSGPTCRERLRRLCRGPAILLRRKGHARPGETHAGRLRNGQFIPDHQRHRRALGSSGYLQRAAVYPPRRCIDGLRYKGSIKVTKRFSLEALCDTKPALVALSPPKAGEASGPRTVLGPSRRPGVQIHPFCRTKPIGPNLQPCRICRPGCSRRYQAD